ncbi:MAG: hypothetical protein CSA33_09160 [Desulfobulbus propionicus]|nr:MAG: hypothetical protein CSA33_09160 [Desulfobulbus propionicus]
MSLPDLLPLERKAMEDFWHSFNTLVFTLYTLPIPVISAIEGHAVAGGTILALATDLRLAAAGKAKMGLNEISLGIPVPLLADMLLKQVVGQRQAMRMMYSGGLMGVDAAHAIGLVDEVHQQDKLFDAAVEKAAQMAEHSGPAFQRIKMGYIEEVVERFRQKQEAYDAAFLDIWFSQPIQEKLNEAAKNF